MADARTGIAVRGVVAALAITGVAGCHEPAAVDDGACRQTGEFGNTGCAVISGTVLGARGQALEGVMVFGRVDAVGAGFASSYNTSGADGSFEVLVTRFNPPASADPRNDTLSFYVVAANQPVHWALGQLKVRDSARTTVRMSQVGQIPTPSNLTLTLDIP